MLELENFGKLLIKEEFTVDTKNHEIIDGLYLGKDEQFFDGYVGLDISSIGKNSYKVIISKIKETVETEEDGKIFTSEEEILYTSKVDNVRGILAAKESFKENDFEAPTLYTWENAKDKSEDFFTINFGGVELQCPKNHNMLADKNILIEYSNEGTFGEAIVDEKISEFYLHNYGLLYVDESGGDRQYYLNENSKFENKISAIVFDNVRVNSLISLNLPNLSTLPERIIFFDNNEINDIIEFYYDGDGLINSGEHCLYESYSIDGIHNPMFTTSLHPFYFDTFDTGLIGYNGDKFCIDQINRYLDDDLLEYTREVYEINPDKKEKLLEEIKKAKEEKQHAIPTI